MQELQLDDGCLLSGVGVSQPDGAPLRGKASDQDWGALLGSGKAPITRFHRTCLPTR